MKRPWIQNETGSELATVFDSQEYAIPPKEKLYYDSAFPDLSRDMARFVCTRLFERFHNIKTSDDTIEAWVTMGYDGE